jgi:CheY-like chemotaxis protein
MEITPRKIVYLADDDEDDRLLFSDAVESIIDECEVTTFVDGEKLIRHLKANPNVIPYIIFIDINMPRMDGFECLKAIKSMDSFKDVPVIMYSTSSSQADIARSRELGANLYVQKPYNYEVMKVLMQQIFETDWSKEAPPFVR